MPTQSNPSPAQAGQYLGAGLQFALTIALCAYAGWWADARWGTSPLLLIGGSILGGVAAFIHLYRSLVGPPPSDDQDRSGSQDRHGQVVP